MTSMQALNVAFPVQSGPILAVTPIATSPDEPELCFLAMGLHEDICGALGRFRSLTVIAPMSAAAVGGVPETEIARRLGASHVLRSRLVRPAADRLQLRLSLTADATHLMSDRIEIDADKVLQVHDEVVARVAGTLAARIDQAELADAYGRAPENLEAYKLTLRGMSVLRGGSRDFDLAARALFEQALELDPRSVRARVGVALSHFNVWSCQFWDRAEEAGRLAYSTAHEALAIDEHDGFVHLIIGKVHLMRRDFERAEWYFDRALALSPHDTEVLIELALDVPFLGHAALGVEHARRAMALNPYHPSVWHTNLGFAQLMARDLEGAALSISRADGHPYIDAPACRTVALAYLGRLEEARAELRAFDDNFRAKILFGQRDPAPGEALRWFSDHNPFARPEDLTFCLDAFRMIDAAPAPAAARADAVESRLVGDSTGWVVTYGGIRTLLGALKGLEDIRRLLACPGDEIHCLDLADRAEETFAGDSALDARGRAEIKSRIRDLQEELAEAEDMNDTGRAERARAELDTLVEALTQALGLGGRVRRLGSLSERARTTVTWRIRHAIRQAAAAHPAFGRHLEHTIKTGTFCSYTPEYPVAWRFDPAG